MEQDRIVQHGKERKEYRPLPNPGLTYAVINGEIVLMKDGSPEERRRISRIHMLNA